MKAHFATLALLICLPSIALAETTDADRKELDGSFRLYRACAKLSAALAEMHVTGSPELEVSNVCAENPQEVISGTQRIKSIADQKTNKEEKAKWANYHKKLSLARAQAGWGEGETYGSYRKRIDQTLNDLEQAKLEIELGI